MEQKTQTSIELSPATRRLVSVAERMTGRRIIIEPTADQSSRAQLTRGNAGEPDRVRYNPERAKHIDHLVAHEVGHALLPMDFEPSERLSPAINFDAVHAAIGPDVQQRFLSLDEGGRTKWERNAALTIVNTLTSLPEDILIEQSIAKEPLLAASQRASLLDQANELSQFMRERPRRNLPPKVRIGAAAMEGVWTSWLARFLNKPDFVQAYRDAGYGDIVAACFEDLTRPTSGSLRECREATDRMADRLGIRSWYRWQLPRR
jgi:hypothetical protein